MLEISTKEIAQQSIATNDTSLGIELGSSRIKAVLIGCDHSPIATGSHDWENQYYNGVWTYSLDAIWSGVQACYSRLKQDVSSRYGVELTSVGNIGISGMMHGYMVFDERGELLVPFRTWRNTFTEKASVELTPLLDFPIPHRWSIAHLYQAIINNEEHIDKIAYMTTIAGYVHWCLTGEKVVGVGDASGMFPIDLITGQFDKNKIRVFENHIEGRRYSWRLEGILPKVLLAGEKAGALSDIGAELLDPTGTLMVGIPLCPPEGDAGTGMAATNSVVPGTGNVSAGTSIFLMAVLNKSLSGIHSEIDLVTTPAGDPVAMVHANNCVGDIDAWASVFTEVVEALGFSVNKSKLYDMLYFKALEADANSGGLLSYNYISGESITGVNEGRPLFIRMPDSYFSLANFMRAHLYSALATLIIGNDILKNEEGIRLERLYGHGGFFKTEGVGQRMMAAATETPVTVMSTAGEGGPWGIALLAAYARNKNGCEKLNEYLESKVFNDAEFSTSMPHECDIEGIREYMVRYKAGLELERIASKHLLRA